ncbi:MAG: hypothetical protein KDB21_18145, partial [Acidimicrobiales bacterium]|nr:hypothetical protein [Acidimicrobiales bacterium]
VQTPHLGAPVPAGAPSRPDTLGACGSITVGVLFADRRWRTGGNDMSQPTSAASAPRAVMPLVTIGVLGAAVAIALGAYGNVHDPTFEPFFVWFFSGQLQLKVWFCTLAIVLALFQVFSAARIYGRLRWPREVPSWFGEAHRLSGVLAFAASLPVAYHCLWALGYRTDAGARVWWHSLLGCTFYGMFVVKVIAVRNHRLPGWTLPVVGGLTFAVLAGLWATSALWFFGQDGLALV